MKIGDYVRFDYHRITVPIMIAKITEEHSGNEDEGIFYVTDTNLVIDESNLVKPPSPNIIDLIEENDIVNHSRVVCIGVSTDLSGIHKYLVLENGNNCANGNIKSIVTKEQFESMEYKVGE